jgi:muramoyltetrapeptide carboxypeptidase
VHPQQLAAIAEAAALNPEVGAVVATSGGWTSLALLPHLDTDLLARHPTAFVGHSDLTVLLNVMTAATGMITYLGPMVLPSWAEHGGPWDLTAASLRRALFGRAGQTWSLEPAPDWTDELLAWEQDDHRRRRHQSHPDQIRVLRPGTAVGQLWGGSIRSLAMLTGTPYWPAPSVPSVLVLDDERLSPDELFALLTSLTWAGAFERCTGVLISKFSRPRPNPTGFADLDAALLEAVPHGIPIAAGLDVGHTEPVHTLPLGARVTVQATDPARPPLLTITLEGTC